MDGKKCFYLKSILNSTSIPIQKILPFKNDKVSIGRDSTCSIVINTSKTISRKHCEFQKDAQDNWKVINYSPNLIFINGSSLNKGDESNIVPDDIIQIGPLNDFSYKFGCKIFPNKRTLDSNNAESSNTKRVKTEHNKPKKTDLSSNLNTQRKNYEGQITTATIENSQQIVEGRLKDNEAELVRLKEEKTSLEQKLESHKKQYEEQNKLQTEKLEKKYKEGILAQKTMLEERENLNKQLNKQLSSLQEKLNSEKLSLETKLNQEEDERSKLLQEKELLASQLKKEQEHEKKLMEEKVRLEKQLMEVMSENDTLHQQVENNVLSSKQKMEEQQKVAVENEQRAQELQKMKENLEKNLNSVKSELLERDMVNITLEQELKLRNAEKLELQRKLEEAKEIGQQAVECLQEELDAARSSTSKMPDETTSKLIRDQFVESVTDVMDNELQCAICSELYITAIILNCGHTFCKFCIDTWKKTKRECPTCRTQIKSETRSITVDNFIDRVVPTLSEELQKKRLEFIEERKESLRQSEAAAAQALADAEARSNRRRPNRGGRGRGRGRNNTRGNGRNQPSIEVITITGAARAPTNRDPRVPTLPEIRVNPAPPVPPTPVVMIHDESHSDDSDLDSDGSILSDSSSVSGDEDVYYGGYGRCYNCGLRGHWANGCPDRW